MNALTKLAPRLAAPEILIRQVPESVPQWLDALAPEALPSARFVARPEDVAGLLPAECAPWLRMDIANLARSFAARTACRDLEVRLDHIDDDACSRFHRDHVSLRLLSAYRGPGTQWVPEAEAEQALREQTAFRGTIHQLPRFSVGIFAGRNHASGGVLHRSPPILGTNVTRLLLCLTPADETCGCPVDH